MYKWIEPEDSYITVLSSNIGRPAGNLLLTPALSLSLIVIVMYTMVNVYTGPNGIKQVWY